MEISPANHSFLNPRYEFWGKGQLFSDTCVYGLCICLTDGETPVESIEYVIVAFLFRDWPHDSPDLLLLLRISLFIFSVLQFLVVVSVR